LLLVKKAATAAAWQFVWGGRLPHILYALKASGALISILKAVTLLRRYVGGLVVKMRGQRLSLHAWWKSHGDGQSTQRAMKGRYYDTVMVLHCYIWRVI
jgi:hypothetical protein